VFNYRVHEDLTFCFVDERPIFLDINADRYFSLSGSMERAFVAWSVQGCVSESDIASLVEERILTNEPAHFAGLLGPTERPSISAVELSSSPQRLGLRTILEVSALVFLTQIQLKTIGIKAALEHALGRHGRLAKPSSSQDRQRLLAGSQTFMQARRYVPVGTRCLLDSLAMARFLRRRRIHVNVVFGVTGAPFSAHCWVQAGEVLLTDAIGNIRIYTPIRVL
jgi:hypothetical protein